MVIFLTDNGPQQNRYRMGLRGKKGSVYDGGIKVPCLIHFPAVFPVNKEIAVPLASIDLLPTILDACGIHLPSGRNIDGKSILPLLKNDDPVFYNRLLFWEWNRGFPIPWQNFAVRKGNYKLVGNTDYNSSIEKFELYNLSADPYESFNIVNEQIKMARELKDEMTNWYYSIINGENYRKIPRIIVGSEFENPVELNRNDAKGSPGIWDQEEIYGYWDVSVARTGNYRVKVQFLKPLSANGRLFLKLYPHQFSVFNTVSSVSTVELHDLFLTAGDYRLEIYYESTENRIIFPLCAEFFKTNKN
jgi:arylsulfatase